MKIRRNAGIKQLLFNNDSVEGVYLNSALAQEEARKRNGERLEKDWTAAHYWHVREVKIKDGDKIAQ